MKPERAFEIAESFVNGNISWVKEQTKRKATFIAVLWVITEYYPNKVESFTRICG